MCWMRQLPMVSRRATREPFLRLVVSIGDSWELFEAGTHQHQRTRVQPNSVMKKTAEGKPEAQSPHHTTTCRHSTELDLR